MIHNNLTAQVARRSAVTPMAALDLAPPGAEICIALQSETEACAQVEEVGASPASRATGGDLALANALVAAGVVPRVVIAPLLHRLQAERAGAIQNGQTLTLLQLLAAEQVATLDDLLGFVVDRSGLPYLSLATYDVDRDIACLVPRELAFEFCLVPFDRISRAVLVAVANPLDAALGDRLRMLGDYDLFWFVSSPAEITNALRQAYGLNYPVAHGPAKE